MRNLHSVRDDTSITARRAAPNSKGRGFLYDVTTRFQKLARRSTSLTRDKALNDAGQVIESLAGAFKEDFRQKIDLLAEQAARRRAGDTPVEWYETLCSISRELRDVGETFGYPLITFVAGNLCTILDGVGPQIGLATVDCHIDALRCKDMERIRHKGVDRFTDLCEGLRRLAAFELERARSSVIRRR